MGDNHLNSKEYAQIQELVLGSNQKSLQALLGFPSKKSQRGDGRVTKLLPSPPKASALLECLEHKVNFEVPRGDQCNLDVEDILQALLMVDPSYITPWDAIGKFSTAFSYDENSVFSMIQCVSCIEAFLLKAKFPLPLKRNSDEPLAARCVQKSMLQLVAEVFGYLRGDSMLSERMTDEGRASIVTPLAMQLLQTVFIVCNGWCEVTFDKIVSESISWYPSPTEMKLCLQLAKQSILLMDCGQIGIMGLIYLNHRWEDSGGYCPERDMPSIVASIVDIVGVLGTTRKEDEYFKNALKLWRKVIIVVFERIHEYCDYYGEECYRRCEECLKDGIQKWDADTLKIWISEIIRGTSRLSDSEEEDDEESSSRSGDETSDDEKVSIPDWFALQLVSLCIETLSKKEIPSQLVALNQKIRRGVVDEKADILCLSDSEYQSILNFVFGSQYNSMLDDLGCSDKKFLLESEDVENLEYSSGCKRLIEKSLRYPMWDKFDVIRVKSEYLLLPRAIRLANMADLLLRNCPDDCLHQVSIFAITVKTISYFEVPEYRTILEREIEQDVSTPSRVRGILFFALRSITCSALKTYGNEEMTDRLFGIIERILTSASIGYLDHILTILPLGQPYILNLSEKLLAPLYSSWGVYEYGSEKNEVIFEPEIQQRITGGIGGLLELITNDDWGETENHAWGILSELIVNNLPPVPSGCRQWLIETFTSSVTEGIYDSGVAEHILRATTTRLSSFFWEYEIESKIHANANQIEEIRSLHRLMMILLQYLASLDEHSESRRLLLAEGRESFLRAILLYKKGQLVGNQFHHGISKQYHSLQKTEPDSFVLCWLAFFKINLYLLDNFLSTGSKIKTFGHLENSSMNQEASIPNLVSKIKEIEIKDAHQDEKSCMASWPHSKKSSNSDSQRLLNLEDIEDFHCSDLLVEFLFLVPLPAREASQRDDPLSWKVVTASGFLLFGSTKYEDSILSFETIEKIAEPFLSTSSFLLRSAIDSNCNLSALDDLLSAITFYCQALNLTLENNKVRDCKRIIGSLWNLYQAMASERACVKMIEYLESRISENNTTTKQGNHQLSLLASVSSESEVDKFIQKLRLSCLRPFLGSMSLLSNADEVGDTNLIRSLVSGILEALVTDLRAGLNGKSGGIPRELYILFCKTIEECGSVLFHHRQSSFDHSVFFLFREVIAALSNILVTVPLRDASLFRTTLILSAAVFPSMCRDLVRNSMCESDIIANRVGKMLRADSVLFDEVLDECIDILIRWAALREPTSVPWLDIAGPDHAEDRIMDNSDVSTPSEEEVNDRIPRYINVPSPPRNNRRSGDSRKDKTPRKIRLFTKELWSWALSCSLLGLEQKWLESERTIQVLDKRENHEETSSIEWNEFFETRTKELQQSLVRIHQFFRASQGLQRRGHATVLDMMAMNLPSAPRLRFCCLLECISRVLIHSIRRLCLVLRQTDSTIVDVSILESISCLSAWLLLEDDSETDFSVGVFKWLAIVSRKSPPGEAPSGKKGDKAELFARVSTVSEEVNGLYLELKELQKLLRNPVASLESIASFFPASDILRSCGLKLHALNQVIPSEFRAKSFPDFPSNGEPVRKRPRSSSKRRPAKKNSVPNRNKVVDMFMNLDRGTENTRSRDAYADLEDFLVEG